MAAPEWELNLFSADPRLLQPQDDRHYEGGAATTAALASSTRLRLLHALAVGERTVTRAAAWARVPQARAEIELRQLLERGLLAREPSPDGELEYAPRDGHLIVLLYVALAHAAETPSAKQPLLLRHTQPQRQRLIALEARAKREGGAAVGALGRRRVASARVRAGDAAPTRTPSRRASGSIL